MQTSQRSVAALIRATGARIAVLPDGRLLEYWGKYSQAQYSRLCADASRDEIFRFINWLNNQPGIQEEVLAAMHDSVAQPGRLHVRSHPVRALNGRVLVERRLV